MKSSGLDLTSEVLLKDKGSLTHCSVKVGQRDGSGGGRKDQVDAMWLLTKLGQVFIQCPEKQQTILRFGYPQNHPFTAGIFHLQTIHFWVPPCQKGTPYWALEPRRCNSAQVIDFKTASEFLAPGHV